MGAGVCLSSLVCPSSGFHPSSRNKLARNQWCKEHKPKIWTCQQGTVWGLLISRSSTEPLSWFPGEAYVRLERETSKAAHSQCGQNRDLRKRGPSIHAPSISACRHPPSVHSEAQAGMDLQGVGFPLVAIRLQFNPYPNPM